MHGLPSKVTRPSIFAVRFWIFAASNVTNADYNAMHGRPECLAVDYAEQQEARARVRDGFGKPLPVPAFWPEYAVTRARSPQPDIP